MDSEKLNKWLSLLANVGVIAGIIFLAIEIRQNSDAVRAHTRAQLAEGVTELFSVNMNDKEYASVLMRGNNLEELTPVERYQYYRHRSAWVHYWNNVAYQYEMGMYDESEFELQISTIRADMETFPGLKMHWCNNKYSASKRLVDAMEGNAENVFCPLRD